MSNYQYRIEKYHSIGEAHININGITVLAGINGSGKSTLAQWLYYIVNNTNGYEIILHKEFKQIVSGWISKYERVVSNNELHEIIYKARLSIADTPYTDISSYTKIIKIFESATKHIVNFLRLTFNSMNDNKSKKRFLNYLRIESNANESDDQMLERYEAKQMQRAEEAANKYLQLQDSRAIGKFYENISRDFSVSDIPQLISFKEDDVEIINRDSIGKLFGLKTAVYIDTPMALSLTYSNNRFWNELRKLLKGNFYKSENDGVVSNLLSNLRNITGGKVIDKEDFLGEKELYFTRESDKLTVKLEQMATGVKSFAYLDRLLENGYLNKDSILILDEPEAHLHPQWIVEYARMLVQIHKETGLYIMLASHDPDMVSAIRYIAEKEDVLKDTAFYLAEQDKNAETFSYKELGLDIEPIFASFNKSFDLIEKYGVDNGI